MEYTIGTKVFGDWEITGKLGEGSSGQVFELYKNMRGVQSKSALKVIRVPKSKDDMYRLMAEGLNQESVSAYYMQIVDEIIREVEIMKSLKAHPHIVSCEDYQFIENQDSQGGTILIRMECLTSLSDYQLTHPLNETEVTRMLKELGNALAYCQEKGLMHRDIKPANIFVSEEGHFKLGDFGVARTTEKATVGVSRKGTEDYMAPEVYMGKDYSGSVDIYSLGLVAYKCLNKNRLPFYPLGGTFSYADKELAFSRRMQGETLPVPVDASEKMGRIILKACEYKAENRYQTARELLEDLERPEVVVQSAGRSKKWMIPTVVGILVLAGAAFGVMQSGILSTVKKQDKEIEKPVEVITEKQTEVPFNVIYEEKVYEATVHGGSGTGAYEAGETVKITAGTPEEGYVFEGWQIKSGKVVLIDSNAAVTEFVMPQGEVEIAAVYEKEMIVEPAIPSEPEIPSELEPPILAEESVPEDGFTGHKYMLFEMDKYGLNTWEKVLDFCEKQGGHIAVIESQEENDFLLDLVYETGERTAFFGYTDRYAEGNWEWEESDNKFSFWAQGQPNNTISEVHPEGENYAQFHQGETSGAWNDIYFGTNTKLFICEWTAKEWEERDLMLAVTTSELHNTFSGHEYRLFNMRGCGLDSWEEVVEFCARQGGYIATINSREENNFLIDFIQYNGLTTAFFGYTDRYNEGNWNWEVMQSEYTNWSPGQPNNTTRENRPEGEDYVQFYIEDTSGVWNDVHFGANTKWFICEWSN